MIVYKIPSNLVDAVKGLKGSEGSKLNPIQDIDGNWILTAEEINSPEFDAFKVQYVDLIVEFEKIEYKPKPDPLSSLI